MCNKAVAAVLGLALVLGAGQTVTGALAVEHGGGGGGGLGGGGFAGHIGVGSAGGRMIGGRMGGDHPAGHGGVFLGNRGGSDYHGTRMGGDLHYRDHDHDRDHHFRQRFIGSPGYYYDDYGYGLDDGVPTDAYPPPTPAVRAPEAEPACHRTSETFNVPAAGGGTREITVIGCP